MHLPTTVPTEILRLKPEFKGYTKSFSFTCERSCPLTDKVYYLWKHSTANWGK